MGEPMRLEIVIPWFVCLYVEIIHKLQRVDYLANRWTGGQPWFIATFYEVDLSRYEKIKGGLMMLIACSHLLNVYVGLSK